MAVPRRRDAPWLALVGVGLALLLAAAGIVQWRQFTLLEQTVRSGGDFLAVQVYQAEAEYLRLRMQWLQALDERRPVDRAELQLRLDIWVSRIELLHQPRVVALLSDQADATLTLQRIEALVKRIDTALGGSAGQALDDGAYRARIATLLPELDALGAPIHTLVLESGHNVGNQMALRNIAVREHNRTGIGITLFLSALTLAFAVIAWQQLRRLEQHRDELEQLAASLRDARRDAEAASAAKSVFLANMSHEIRTPFHGLLGMLSLLRETGLSPRQIDLLRTATESADHLLAILNDILDMSQLESGRMTLLPAPVDLRRLLHAVEALMRPQALAKGLALHIDAAADVPDRVLADATRIKQVLFNLLSNAIKFSERGAVVLDARRRTESGDEFIDFVVTDTGIGMSAEMLDRLFERFAPGDASRSRRHAGAGLGLEISRSLARLMGGDIGVRSAPGAGSTFTFRLPLQVVASESAAPAGEPEEAGPAALSLDVLVAEDHPVNQQYLAALLDSLGHRAHIVGNGEAAVEAVRQRGFDLVLMDLHMPVLDGLAATVAIRALPDAKASAVPIVALTADAFTQTRDRCLLAGMNDFLTKPVSPERLATSLRRLFGTTAAEAALPDRGIGGAPALPPPGSTPLLDEGAIAAALQAISRERLAAMIDAYLTQAPQTLAHLRAALRDAQPLELRVHAHAARGAALNLGLAGLAATAEALHSGAAALPAHEVARLVQQFEDLLPATRAAAAAAGLGPSAATAGAAERAGATG